MKILVCTDGSEHSNKALEKASIIIKGCNATQVVIIHVYEENLNITAIPYGEGYVPSDADLELFKKKIEEYVEERKELLSEALKFFEEKNIKATTILKQGHPAKTILELASEKGFDMIVLGSRGFGGWKKRILGSVSSAVVQEAKNCTVVIVK